MKTSETENIARLWANIKTDRFSERSASLISNLGYGSYCLILCRIFEIVVARKGPPFNDEVPYVYFCSRWPFSVWIRELPMQESWSKFVLVKQAAEQLQLARHYHLMLQLPPIE